MFTLGARRWDQSGNLSPESAPAATVAWTPPTLSALWPEASRIGRLSDIGRGKGIIFSPDFSARGNREFYERLGFAYFEDASWHRILNQIKAHNSSSPE